MNTHIPLAIAALSFSCLLIGCEDKSTSGSGNTVPPGGPRTTSTNVPGPVPDTAANAKADNTANNHPDRSISNKTPMDQSQSQPDIDITAGIRSAIMKADNMSTNAQNCKIITDKGAVTLRGPVNSQAEKDAIDAIAKRTPGVVSITNLLEVKTP